MLTNQLKVVRNKKKLERLFQFFQIYGWSSLI